MVSFSCENCGDVLTKKKLDPHRNQCRGASFTCIDCMVHFQGFDYRAHTSCISEAQKYQGHLYREKDNKKKKGNQRTPNNAMANYKSAYVEDAADSQLAIVDVPPRAPTPPTREEAEALPGNINVFDYLVQEATPTGKDARRALDNGASQSSADGSQYRSNGYAYGSSAVTPSFQRYESFQTGYGDSQDSQALAPPSHSYVTPAPKASSKDKHSKSTTDKKRKRTSNMEDLDTSRRPSSRDEPMPDAPASAGRVLHSGLTGGLSRLVTDPEFYEDRIEAGPTPVSPLKRSRREAEFDKASRRPAHSTSQVSSSRHSENPRQRKRHSLHPGRRDESVSSADDREISSTVGQLTTYAPSLSRADMFLSFITKGPDSERGCSVHKAMKRYHRERGRDVRGDAEREVDDKELFKALRLKRNDRGEIVLFVD